MKALLARVVVVLAAFFIASVVAAFVITVGVLMEWQEVLAGTAAGWLTVAFFGLIVSAKALLPAMLLIALSEGLGIRSSLFYAASGGVGLVALYYGFGLAEREGLLGRDLEIMAGAGIAAGLVYWMIAGRKAGCWRRQDAPSIGA